MNTDSIMSQVDREHYYIFTDGACSKNGKPGARASYAAIIGTGDEIIGNAYKSVSGLVVDQAYVAVDPAAPEKGFTVSDGFVAASNNRGELLGIISALLMVINHAPATVPAVAPAEAVVFSETVYEIVSDSRISLMTLLEWLPNRRATNTTHKLKNMDLLTIAEALLARARERARIELVHVHSHRKPPAAGAPERDRVLWRGNATVDSLATAELV